VTDLKPDDFEIVEDGRPQKITNFSYIRTAGPPRPAAMAPAAPRGTILPPPPLPAAMRREAVRRTIVLVVDDLGLSFESMGGVRHDLKRFAEQQIEPGDLVAIVRTSGGMGALDQFTTDRRILLHAVDRLRWYPSGRGGLPAIEPVTSHPGRARDARVREAQWRRVAYSLGTLGAVSYLVRGMRDMPGRKSLILISDGLRLRSGGERDERLVEALRHLTDQANRSAVVLYSIDARGIQTLAPTAAGRPSLEELAQGGVDSHRLTRMLMDQEGLEYLAHETGGFLAHASNRIDADVGEILEDLQGYYLIGYKPDPSRFRPRYGDRPDFHTIRIQVKQRGLHVRSRAGYYGYADRPKPAQDQLRDALFSPFASPGVHLRLTPLFSEPAAAGPRIMLLLHIDARDLTFSEEPGGLRAADADLVGFVVDERGLPVDTTSYKAVIRLKPDEYAYALRAGFAYTASIPVSRPGPYHIRVAVRDIASGKIGTASQFLEVPDLKKRRLALSGLVLEGPAGKRPDPEAPGVPSFRVFHHGGALDFSCQIFNARVDRKTREPVIDTEVRVFRGQQEVIATAPKKLDVAPGTSSRTVASGVLSLGALEPGSYVLQLVVHDTLAKERHGAAAEWMDFDVVP
jgi:VWFA-related protein